MLDKRAEGEVLSVFADLYRGKDTSDRYPSLLMKPHTFPEEAVFRYKK